MQETVFCRTCCLQDGNCMTLTEDIRKWLPHASVYVQLHPMRIVVCRGAVATLINKGDVFSLVQRFTDNVKVTDIVNHSEKQGTVRINVNGKDFLIETFVAKTVGDTENMKFRLTCLFNPEISRDFDDYASLSNELNNYIWTAVDEVLL